MKKILFLLSGIAFLLSSCSNDNSGGTVNSSSDILPVKAVQTYGNGSTLSIDIVYDENKVQKLVYDNGTVISYTYSGSLVSKVQYFYNQALWQEDFYEYQNDKLINFKRLEYEENEENGDYVVNVAYVYNSDGTVGFTRATGYTTNPSAYMSTGTFTFDALGQVLSVVHDNGQTETFSYDDKNSPFKNILGFDKLSFQDVYPNSYKHNFLSEVSSDNTVTTHVYTYNSNGYPMTDEEDDGYGISTTQYFYSN